MTATKDWRQEPMTPYERLRLQVECGQRHRELLEDAQQLRRAGRIREARKLEESAHEISERLRALEEPAHAAAQHPKR